MTGLKNDFLHLLRMGGLALLIMGSTAAAWSQQILNGTRHTLSSPDSSYAFSVYQKAAADGRKQLYYALAYKGKQVILESELGVLVENRLFESALAIENDTARVWGENLDFRKASRSSRNESW